jgi:Secretion system C-terminal sorting domain
MLRMHKFSVLLITVIVLAIKLPVEAQFGTVIYSNDFNNQSGTWNPISLSGDPGSIELSNGSIKITSNPGSIHGAYFPSSFSGHFEAEIEFDNDHGIGLALIKEVGGVPSLDDYSLLTVMTNADGFPVIQLKDVQKGVENVLDNSNKVGDDKFLHLLDGNRYSVPFTKTAKKLKIFRHSNQQFLHFYYAVEKEVDGKIYDDWMELSPSREWGDMNGRYFVGIFSLEGTTSYNKVTVRELPLKDQSDLNTGFAVVRRPYTWSGYTDTATVVTFGAACPFAAEERKFVFWNLTNNIPVWHLNNGALMSHGFLETWDEPRVLGCIEPMSDRLLAFVDLEVIEDNPVRKVIKWTYELVNPDYKYPAFGETTQRAEATEYYYVYADGSVIRKAEYEHTLHPSFTKWYEHTELIIVAGENQRPLDLFDTPSTIIHELGKDPVEHTNRSEFNFFNGGQRLGATAITARVNNAPELFYAFSDDTATPQTHTELPFTYEITWHNRNLNFGHWPVNKEPYLDNSNYCVNWSEWRQHISHASFIGVSVRGNQSWNSSFLQRADGTKYRQLLMLMGMNARGSETTVEDKTNSWLYPGDVVMANDSASFIQYSHRDKYFEFEVTKQTPACYFDVTPKTKLVNPILRIKGWGNNNVFVSVNSALIDKNKCVTYIDTNGDLLLLILGSFSGNVRIEVSTFPIPTIVPPTKPGIKIYPNPVNKNTINIVFDSIKAVELVLFSIKGEEVLRKSFESDQYQLQTENLPSGNYMLRINSGNQVMTEKLVIW